jgi:hypothetical protein
MTRSLAYRRSKGVDAELARIGRDTQYESIIFDESGGCTERIGHGAGGGGMQGNVVEGGQPERCQVFARVQVHRVR